MLEFVRVLTPDQITILRAINQPKYRAGDRYLGRTFARKYDKILRNLNRKNELSNGEYDSLIKAIEEVQKFAKGRSKYSALIDSITPVLQNLPRRRGLREEWSLELIKWIKDRASDYDNPPTISQEEDLRAAIKANEEARYSKECDKPLCNMSNSKIERVVQSLQGIMSIEMGKWGQYHDLFVPRIVYESVVRPAIKDPHHRLIITLKDEKDIQILRYVYMKTSNLRKRFGNGFRPTFTRPELSRAIEIEMPKQGTFRKMMLPLEGILGRIETKSITFLKSKEEADSASHAVEEDANLVSDMLDSVYRQGYAVHYNRPSWFLSLHHQRLLDQDFEQIAA